MTESASDILNPAPAIRSVAGYTLPSYITDVAWRGGFTPGCGIDAITGSVKATAISSPFIDPNGNMTVSQYSQSVTNQTQSDDLFSGFISASVNVEGISGSASTSFLTEVNYSSTSSTVLTFRKDLEADYGCITSPTLTDEAKSLMNASGSGFRDTYGDYFIDGIISGSQLIFMLEFTSDTEANHTVFMASISADIPDQLSADFQTQVQSAASTTNTAINFTVYQQGAGEPGTPLSWEQENLDDLVKNYIASMSPIPQYVRLAHYSTIAGCSNYSQVVNFDPDAASSITTLYQDFWTIIQLFNNAESRFTALFNGEFQAFSNGLKVHQDDLITDAAQYYYYRTLADRLLAYFYAIDAIPSEQAVSGTINNETKGGLQQWQFGFRDMSRAGLRKASVTVLRENHGDTGSKGGALQFVPDPPAPTAIIVGWEVIANWTDGTDGHWNKDPTVILMSSAGNAWAQSLKHRGLNWTANYYYVVPGDIPPPQ